MTGPETNMECHPLEPFLPDGTRLLMCGTFPPARSRWSMEFYYPNFINDMWRIFGLIVYGDRDALVDKERSRLCASPPAWRRLAARYRWGRPKTGENTEKSSEKPG